MLRSRKIVLGENNVRNSLISRLKSHRFVRGCLLNTAKPSDLGVLIPKACWDLASL